MQKNVKRFLIKVYKIKRYKIRKGAKKHYGTQTFLNLNIHCKYIYINTFSQKITHIDIVEIYCEERRDRRKQKKLVWCPLELMLAFLLLLL